MIGVVGMHRLDIGRVFLAELCISSNIGNYCGQSTVNSRTKQDWIYGC